MRAFVVVLDSAGCGNAPDAPLYGDEGAHTLGHILEIFPELKIPHLRKLGLGGCIALSDGTSIPEPEDASFGVLQERSAGKDTTTGHWELAGVILSEPFAVYENFPASFLDAIGREAGTEFLGNFACSGTEILALFGEEHLSTGFPIVYTSADSVLQIAAHESLLPRERLYEICRIARKHADALRISRVIARPFEGEPGAFRRTSGRHDFAFPPPRTVLDALVDAGHTVTGVGKISDIFAGQGFSNSHPTASNQEGMVLLTKCWEEVREGLVFANLVDFDMLYGHRRDCEGYARALEEFDVWLGAFLEDWNPEDLLIITADHGNDPTFLGTDHTREQVPLLMKSPGPPRVLGIRSTFADVAATLAEWFELEEFCDAGTSLLGNDSEDYS